MGTRSLLVLALLTMAAQAVAAEPLLDLKTAVLEGPDPKKKEEWAKPVADGQAFVLDLGTKRTNWTNAQWRVTNLPAIRDLSKYAGIRITVKTDKPRSDAGVYIAIREADGSWYYCPWAANLTATENTGVAKFEDFSPAEWLWPGKTEADRKADKAAEAQREARWKEAAATQPDLKKPEYHEPPGHFDENGRLDLDKISHVAIGCVNPSGVGKVEFTVTALELVEKAPAAETSPVKVEVTGKLLDVNGQTTVPAGIFGGFHYKWTVDGKDPFEALRLAQDRSINGPVKLGNETTWMFINTWGDRTGRSPRATDPNWQANAAKQGTDAAEKAKAAGKPLFVEYWNEPYLNWSNKNRIMFNPAQFVVEEAKEGGEVKLKIDGTVCPHLKWTQKYEAPPWNWVEPRYQKARGEENDPNAVLHDNWRRGRDAKGQVWSDYAVPFRGGKYNVAYHPPKDVKDGETYKVKVFDPRTKKIKEEVELTAFTPWWVYDETQFTFWSSQGMAMFYDQPMLAAGKAIKAVKPDATYIAGWDFRVSEDSFAGWELVYKPTIDFGHEVIDGVSDHDYGGEATKMSANYEVITAYGVTKYGKWLKGYNTECAASIDPQAYAGAELGAAVDGVKYTWGARKLMHLLTFEPDKAGSVSWFGEGGSFVTEAGEGTALKLLKNFRGKLVQVTNPDPTVLVAACIDGTDPRNPRPKDMEQRKELVVAVLNDHPDSRKIDLTIAPPKGTKFGSVIVRRAEMNPATKQPRIVEKELKADKPEFAVQEPFASRELVVYTFPLTGDEPAKPEVARKQFFGSEIVKQVTPDKAVTESIKVDAAALTGAKRAWVRFVAEKLQDGEGLVTVNGKEYKLPEAVTPENTPALRELSIPVADLKAGENAVVFKAALGQAGWLLGAGSIIVERSDVAEKE